MLVTEEAVERMFRETCYACHNHWASPEDHAPAEKLKEPQSGFTWGHKSECMTTGYVGCYASRLRNIAEDDRNRQQVAIPCLEQRLKQALEKFRYQSAAGFGSWELLPYQIAALTRYLVGFIYMERESDANSGN